MTAKKARKQPKKTKPSLRSVLIACGLTLLVAIIIAVKLLWFDNDTIPDYIIAANASSWHLKKVAYDHQIEGYASAGSVIPGDYVDLKVSCDTKFFATSVYRMGWSNGKGAQLVTNLGVRTCQKHDLPSPDKSTGLVNADWPVSYHLKIPKGWRSGIYLAKITTSRGYQNYIPFTVRTADPHSKYLFVHSINTDSAYNKWGGNSLYTGSTPDLKLGRAVKVSLNRPYLMPGKGNDGSGNFLKWEYPMILFLEKNGYQVDYATDIDVHEHPERLLKYKAVIITGHDEYWSKQMLDGYKAALAHGVNLAIFAANTAYRPIRFEPDPLTGQPDRVIVNYKSAELDPFTQTNPQYSTPAGWQSPPLNQPESMILGDSYGGEISGGAAVSTGQPLVVSDESSWIFKNTGLKNGDKIAGLVGYEYDKFIESSPHPPNVDLIFHSALVNIAEEEDFSDSTYYSLPNGGQVFNAGTIEWSLGLDPDKPAFSPAMVKITENILDRFGRSQL